MTQHLTLNKSTFDFLIAANLLKAHIWLALRNVIGAKPFHCIFVADQKKFHISPKILNQGSRRAILLFLPVFFELVQIIAIEFILHVLDQQIHKLHNKRHEIILCYCNHQYYCCYFYRIIEFHNR